MTTTKQASPQVGEFDAVAFIAKAGSMSAAIRQLDKEGKARGDIARMLSTPTKKVIYQWVRNVLITPIKKK